MGAGEVIASVYLKHASSFFLFSTGYPVIVLEIVTRIPEASAPPNQEASGTSSHDGCSMDPTPADVLFSAVWI